MDVSQLKDNLYNKEEYIRQILESAGFLSIRKNGNEFRCQWDETHTVGGVQVKIDTLKANAYSMNFSGDIITLIQRKLNLSFLKSMKWICSELGIEETEFEKKEIVLPFGGFFKQIKKEIYGLDECKTYEDDVLNEYGNIPCIRFLKDGISVKTQEKYKVGYDVKTNRITVAWRDVSGRIIGIMGRINEDNCSSDIAKWLPLIPFSKNFALFGMYENYNSIIEKEVCFIGESEKTSMVLDSMGLPIGLGLGGNVVSDYKSNLIKSMRPKKIILIMDEGLPEEISIRNATMLKSDNEFYRNKVGYVYDRENKYLPKDSKASPYDYGKKILEKLIKNCVVWI